MKGPEDTENTRLRQTVKSEHTAISSRKGVYAKGEPVEQKEFPCECGAMVSTASSERELLPGTTETFVTAHCFDCGRQFNSLEIELVFYHQRVLRQDQAQAKGATA